MFEIVVSKCKRSGDGWRSNGELSRTSTKDPIIAKSTALLARAKGVVVTLRPQFNEPHLGDHSFREWRSFDDGLFSEIHWVGGGEVVKTPSQVRLDAEIVLPHPPA